MFSSRAKGSMMTLEVFHRRSAALTRHASSRTPLARMLKDYAALERVATRDGVTSLTDIQIRRWIAEQSIIIAELRTEPFAIVGPLMLRCLALGFASPFEKYVAVSLFADYCERVGGDSIGNYCLLAALSDLESNPGASKGWRPFVDKTFPSKLRKAWAKKHHSWERLIDLAGGKGKAMGRRASRKAAR